MGSVGGEGVFGSNKSLQTGGIVTTRGKLSVIIPVELVVRFNGQCYKDVMFISSLLHKLSIHFNAT